MQIRTVIQLLGIASLCFLIAIIVDNTYSVLPTSIHNHLPAHHPGTIITDISIKTCTRGVPFSSCQLDPKEWHRLEKDLYLEKSWTRRAYLHIQSKQESEFRADDAAILDLHVGRTNPSSIQPPGPTEEWTSRPGGLWLLRSSKRHESDSGHAITAVDVLFGPDAADPRPGWRMRDTPLLIDSPIKGLEPHITVRTGQPHIPTKPILRIRRDGKFKIMQASDLHLATGFGVCRDALPEGQPCDADPRTLEFVSRLLDTERPDLVILSGDQINGDTSPDTQTPILKLADLFIRRQIPYAAIFGNHDDEKTPLSRQGSMSVYQSLPYSLTEPGPTSISGIGNYVLEVLAAGTSTHAALTLYLLDTHTYSPDEKHYHGYDWLKEDQIAWFRETSRALKAKHAKYAKIHLDMAFIHIPLPEYREKGNLIKGGEWREGVTAPRFDSGFGKVLVEEGVGVVSCGHDHVNDYCALQREHVEFDNTEEGVRASERNELWMCYAGGAGFGGYGGYGGYHRRIRFWEVDANNGRIMTYKKLEYGDTESRIDELVVVDGGRVVG